MLQEHNQLVVDPMANAMKKPAKPQTLAANKAKSAKTAAVKTTKPVATRPAAKKVAVKPPVKTKAEASKVKMEKSSVKVTAKKAAPAATTRPKSASKAATPASVQSKAPVTNKKSEVKPVGKPAKVGAKVESRPGVNVMITATVSQTTDAATLAAIDTSGYILPSVKVPGRRGRKPKEFQPENDEIAALNAVERAELKAVDKAKAKDRKAKEKALLKDAFSNDTEASEEELEARRQKLKTLIKFGKERGFLTYAEINDHLPENIIDPEAIEGIIGTFNDMGIAVYEQAPDAETLLLSDNVATVASDDEAEAAAEAALSTVDSDFGRTTDPVRMYMREMGSVELLTREGEIEIAKRIEEGLKDMIQASSACPVTIAEIIAASERIRND
jgi:RNA polymerase primary sigma factor